MKVDQLFTGAPSGQEVLDPGDRVGLLEKITFSIQ
jgi:hypothetical protein